MGSPQINADTVENQHDDVPFIRQGDAHQSQSQSQHHPIELSEMDSTPDSASKPGHISTSSSTSTAQDVDAKKQRGCASPRSSSITTTTESTSLAVMGGSGPTPATMLCFCALTLSIFLVALDTVLIPTALPSISLDFHIPDSLYAWTGSAYLLANAASIPFWGKLSDVFGRKPIILISNAIFLGGSLICAVSVDAKMLVAGRATQGLGGGGVNVLVYVCVADMFAIRYVAC